MTDTTPLAQKLLEQARVGHEPTAADEARVRAALHARVLANPLLLSAKGSHTLAAAAKLTWGKVALALGLGGAAVVGAVVVSQGLGSRAPAAGARQASAAASAPSPLANTGQGAPLAATVEVDAPAPSSAPVAPQRRLSGTASASASASLSTRDMQLEIAGLSRAQQLLHSGNAGQALNALEQLSQQVPRGALMEERDATRALAQCALARSSSAAAAFLARYPKSVHAARVRAACTAD